LLPFTCFLSIDTKEKEVEEKGREIRDIKKLHMYLKKCCMLAAAKSIKIATQ
jgi:hypothetical protein